MTTTTDEFVSGVKSRISMPASQVLFTDADIMAAGDKVTTAYLVPILVSLRQDFFVTTSLFTTVANQDAYDVPYRALGRGLRDLKIIDSSSTTRDLALVQIEDAHRFNQTTTVHSFYFKGDKIILVPPPTDAMASIQFWFENPPQTQCAVSASVQILSINTLTGVVMMTGAVPSTMAAGVEIDFVKGRQGNSTLGMDVVITSVATPAITFDPADLPSDLAAGDYVSLAQTTPIVQLPDDCVPLLETRTCRRILQSIGDYDGANALSEEITEETKNLKIVLEPRIQGEPTIIMNRNGLLRGRRFFARRGLLY